jgi:hypothetical protein
MTNQTPASLRLTPDEEAQLAEVRRQADIRFDKFKKAERFKGRVDFPPLPYERSWAFEEEFRRRVRA